MEFETFVAEASAAAIQYAFARGASLVEAEDIVQNALVTLYCHWDSLGKGLRGPAWAYFWKVVRSEFVNFHRQRVQRTRTVHAMMQAELVRPTGEDGLREIETRSQLDDLLEGLAARKPRAAEVVRLRLAGLHDEAISTALRIAPVTAQRYFAVALRDLRATGRGRVAAGRVLDGPGAEVSLPPTTPGPDFWERRDLEEAVRRLSVRERQVIELARIGTAPVHIGRQLGISANCARVTLCHARRRLRQTLATTPERLEELLRKRTKTRSEGGGPARG
ncbi:hypothetical protein [Kitasatospora sp. NPDC002965]|uniref:hypothetical protein n=1 Tax=Kitasatospora sp. NPDC002965 TaxID=3154775 RepID=UPI0033BF19EE